MPRMRVVLACVILLLAGCGTDRDSALSQLHPCAIAEGPPDAFCGALTVFENRETRIGRTIDLKIVGAPALRRDAKPAPLFVFEGGPGGGAATLAAYRIPISADSSGTATSYWWTSAALERPTRSTARLTCLKPKTSGRSMTTPSSASAPA